MRLDPAGCEAATRALYGDALGLEEIEKPEPLRAHGGVCSDFPAGQQLHVGVDDAFVPAHKAHPASRSTTSTRSQRGSRRDVGRRVAGRAPLLRKRPVRHRLEFLA